MIEGCNREFTALEALVKPKKKFAFSKNKKNLSQPTTTATNESGIPLKADHTAQTINCNADIDAISTNPKPTGAFEVLGSFSLFERSNEKLFLCNKSSEDDSSNGSDLLKIKIESNCQLLIKGCDSCTIRV